MRRPSVRRFIGIDERSAEKPACISPEIERQWARAMRSPGYRPAFGLTSLRYSAIASVSHTVTPSCTRHGTRINEAPQLGTSVEVIGGDNLFLELEPRQPSEEEAAPGTTTSSSCY